MFTLATNDGQVMVGSNQMIENCKTIKNLLADFPNVTQIDVPYNQHTLHHVFTFCSISTSSYMEKLDKLSRVELAEIIKAADYLEYNELYDLTAKFIGNKYLYGAYSNSKTSF
jgi:hypothetical protein